MGDSIRDNDNYYLGTLEEEEEKRKQKERQLILDNLDFIEKQEFPTPTQSADYVRGKAALEGRSDRYSGYNSQDVLQIAQAFQDPNYIEPYKPTFLEQADYKLNQQAIRMWTHDMPAMYHLTLASDSELGAATREANGLPPATTEEIEYASALQKKENFVNFYKERNTKIFQHNAPQMSGGVYHPKLEEQFYNEQGKELGMLSDFEIEDLYQRAKEDSKFAMSQTLKILNDKKRLIDENMKNNPKYAAIAEWASEDGYWNEDEYFRAVGSLAIDVVPSLMTSIAGGRAGQLLFGGAAQIAAGLTPGPVDDALVFKANVLGFALGQTATSGLLNGGSYLYENWENLTQNKPVSQEEYEQDMKDAHDFYTENPKFASGEEGMSIDDYVKQHMLENYVMDQESGQIIRLGLPEHEALEATAGAAFTYAAVAGMIENISHAGKIARTIPGGTEFMDKIMKVNFFDKTSRFFAKKAKYIPRNSGPNRLANYLVTESTDILTGSIAEGLEEVLQGGAQATIAAVSDTEGMFGGGLTSRPGIDIPFEHGGFKQLRDEFLGGFIGGGLVQTVTGADQLLGVNQGINNFKSKRKIGKQVGTEYVYEKNNQGLFEVRGYKTYKEGDKLKVENVDVPVDSKGKTIETLFSRRLEAVEAIEILDAQQRIKSDMKLAWDFQETVGGEAKLVENENGNYVIEITNADGKVIEGAGGDTEFTPNWRGKPSFKARRALRGMKDNLSTIATNFKEHGLDAEDAKDNFVIKEHESDKKKAQEKATKKIIKAVEEIADADTSMGIALFMGETVDEEIKDDEKKADAYSNNLNKKELFTNPEDIINIVKQDKDNKILGERGHEPEDILNSFDEIFGPDGMSPHPEFESLKQQLSDNLQGPPIDEQVTPDDDTSIKVQGESLTQETPPTETGPPVETGPPDTEQQDIVQPDELPPGAPTGGQRKAYSEYTDKELSDEISKITKEKEGKKEGTTERILADKRIELLQKEVDKRKPEEKKLKKKAKKKAKVKKESPDTRRPEEVFDAFDTDEQKAGKKFAREFLKTNKGTALGLINDLHSSLTNKLGRKKISKEFADAAKEEMKRLADEESIKKKVDLDTDKPLTAFEKRKAQIENVVGRLINLFDNKINVKTLETVQDLKDLGLKPEEFLDVSGWFDANTNTIYINLNNPKITVDTAFHEFAHPFISLVAQKNPKLFNGLYQEAIKADPALRTLIDKKYPNDSEQTKMEEVIAHSIDKLAGKTYQQLESMQETNPLKRFWNKLKRFFNYLMDKWGVKSKDDIYSLLTPSTTLKDISNYLVNHENKYRIDISDVDYHAIVSDVANENLNTVSSVESTNLKIADVLLVGEINEELGELKDQLLLTEITESNVEGQIEKILNKRFKVLKKKWKANLHLSSSENYSATYEETIINSIKSAVRSYNTVKPEKQSRRLEKIIEKYASLMSRYGGELNFRYALIEKHLTRRAKEGIQVSTLAGLEGLKKDERKLIKNFISEMGWSKDAVIKGSDIIKEYISYNNKQLGLEALVTKSYADDLSYENLLLGINKAEISDFPNPVHRVLITEKSITYEGLAHSFKSPYESSYSRNISPIGWYAMLDLGADGKLLHEFQSDLIPETLEMIKSLNRKFKDKKTYKRETVKGGQYAISDYLKKGINDEIRNIILQKVQSNTDSNLFNFFSNYSSQKDTPIVLKINNKELIDRGYLRDSDTFELTSKVMTVDALNQLVRNIFNTIGDNIRLLNSVARRIGDPQITREHLLEAMDNVIATFGESLEFTHTQPYPDDINIVKSMKQSFEHTIRAHETADTGFMMDSKIHDIFGKVLFQGDYSNSFTIESTSITTTKAAASDVIEILDFFRHGRKDSTFLHDFENKENQIYKSLVRLFEEEIQKSNNPENIIDHVGKSDSWITRYISDAFKLTTRSEIRKKGTKFLLGDIIPGGPLKGEISTEYREFRESFNRTVAQLEDANKIYQRNKEQIKPLKKYIEYIEMNPSKNVKNLFDITAKSYINEFFVKNASSIILYDTIGQNENFEIDERQILDSTKEYKNANRVLDLAGKNWFEKLIMHGIRHSYAANPEQDIYLNTGTSITLIQGNDLAAPVYYTEEEALWTRFTEIAEDINSQEVRETLLKPLYDEILANNKIEESKKIIMVNYLAEFLGEERQYEQELLDQERLAEMNEPRYEDYFEGDPPEAQTFAKSYFQMYGLDINDSDKILLNYIRKESENKDVWNSILNTKFLVDKTEFRSYDNVAYNTALVSLAIEHNANKKQIKKGIDKFLETLSVKPNFLQSNPAGPFIKSTKDIEKNELYGVKFTMERPEWSVVPLLKAVITDDKKLIPLKFKKDLDTKRKSRDIPESMESFERSVAETITNLVPLDELDVRSEQYRIIKDYFERAWATMQRITGKEKVDIYEFQQLMSGTINETLVPAFEDWWENKFEGQMENPTRVKKIGSERYKFVDKLPQDELQKDYDDWAEGSSVQQMIEKGATDERLLTLNDLLYFKSLSVSITPKQLETIAFLANNKKRMPSYEIWRDYVLKNVLNKSTNITTKQDNEMHKYYNRVRSMIRVNRDGDGAANQRDNFVVKLTSKKVKGVWKVTSIKIEKKKTENIATGNKNNKYDKATLFELTQGTGLFTWIDGGDVLSSQFIGKDPMNNPIYRWQEKYGFIKGEELLKVEAYLRKMGYTIAFSRGDSSKLALVKIKDIHKEISSKEKAADWWDKEIKRIANNPDELELLENELPELLSGTDEDRAAQIAVHQAVKAVFPRYLLDPKGGANVFKRLKIPFTPVTISTEMPPIRIDKFNPQDVLFEVVDKNGNSLYETGAFSPIIMLDGVPTYVGDGNSITSQRLFDEANAHHGLRVSTAKFKTVIYDKDGEDALAIKHEHVLAARRFVIRDKNTNEILYSTDNNRYIYEGDIYSQDKKDLQQVDMLVTDDEVKVGDLFRGQNTIQVGGDKIGAIKYDEESKSTVKHIMQWYNYVQDEAVLNQFRKIYGDKLRDGAIDALSQAIDRRSFTDGILGDISSPKKVENFLKKYSGKDNEGFALTMIELSKLGAGLHPSMEATLDILIQSQIMGPALGLSNSDGSIYDVSTDWTGTLTSTLDGGDSESEVGLAIQNSGPIKERVRALLGREPKITEINQWLEENPVYVMVTRSPVAYIGGAYMARVKRVHSRRSMADLNPLDVKVKLEGDGDGDEVHVEFLDSESTEVYKSYMDTIKPTALNLNRFMPKQVKKMSSSKSRLDNISALMAGSTAIAEIANVIAIYGMMNKTFSGFKYHGVDIKLKKPTDKIKFGPGVKFDGVDNKWEGTVEEYLRIWLQAAVDNNEFGLLHEWDYQNIGSLGLLSEVFEGKMPESDFKLLIGPMIDYYKKILAVKRGRIYAKIKMHDGGPDLQPGTLRLSEVIRLSRELYNFGRDKESFNQVKPGDNKFRVVVKNRQLTPYEMVGLTPYLAWQRVSNDLNLIGLDNTPYMLLPNAHKNAHKFAFDYLKNNVDLMWEQAKKIDLENGTWNGINEKEFLKSEVTKGINYTKDMGNSFYKKLVGLKNPGGQIIDRNEDFIEWKLGHDETFKGLSKVAKVAATMTFLQGYLNLSESLEKNAIKKNTRNPRIFPPVSKSSNEISLLDSGVIEAYFKQYNHYLNTRNDNVTSDIVTKNNQEVHLIKSVLKTCGG